ncbi:AAA family ATPase [Dactylosporangium sp. AC04546]|uniref:AAA family ATPase n=1 Tax=Dactylosporangium sp. AC04546 TaxID=2862460 RepID=UPI001EDF4D9E|nr:AAA family ATPase [Dactylosporangium sp. AC04546]WVK84972.1 AAA family ATPase [Dactylosporangium sp. AC04546]
MSNHRSVVINGDLGSGKSTVSVELAGRLGLRRISVGDMYREMAQRRGMTALQLNLHAELDDAIDSAVDQLQSEIAKSGEQLIVDSRLAWFFFHEAFKVHLITEPNEAARRVLARPHSEVENYSSLEEAKTNLRSRSESERMRFLTRYGADKFRLRNYDLVCDSTRARPDDIVELVQAAFEGRLGGDILREKPPLLLLDPMRVYPTRELDFPAPTDGVTVPEAMEPLTIGHSGPDYYVIDGHRRLSAAVQAGLRLVPASLLAEGEEAVTNRLSANDYFRAHVTRDVVDAWERLHKIELPVPAHNPPEVHAGY